jgi:hypothetical protein
VPEVSQQRRDELTIQLLAMTRADRTAGRIAVTRSSSDDGHWACNGFTSSTVSATGLRAVGASVRPHLRLVFLLDQACAAIGFASAQR